MLRATLLVLTTTNETVESHANSSSVYYDAMLASIGVKERTHDQQQGHSWRLETGDSVAQKIINFLPAAYRLVV